jgi:serine phosphatase RsbU (regulator of sigma subunit)
VRDMLPPGEARDLLEQLGPATVAVLPLRGRGRTLGLLTLYFRPGSAPSEEDVATAQDVADRAGLALDNARLYGAQQQLAEGLQRSLLTEPPEPDHAEIAVRYLPAAEAARVGGDWYDAFMQPSGSTMLVIGDVVGHDTAAAAAMGQLRGLLRGIATYSDAGPVEVLRGLDASMTTLQTRTLATAAVARFEQTPDELERGVTRMRWANAGHLPPLVINPDGSVAELANWKGDLLLGVDPDTVRRESVVTLDRGSTVLLYTDGLIERRDADLDAGLVRLRDTLTELAGRPLDELLDEVIERLVHGRPEDDVAIVAVRLHRQDRPRPAEAGPNSVPPDVPPERPTA